MATTDDIILSAIPQHGHLSDRTLSAIQSGKLTARFYRCETNDITMSEDLLLKATRGGHGETSVS